jgi:2-amino-4-hydroxy-6-hydroxymethyldihydropteridine diphosphokinase
MAKAPTAEALRAQVYLALGGNIGDSRAILERAIALLCDGKAIKLLARSSDYLTPPWGMKYQPPFVNLAIAVETTLTPRALLERTQAVELQLGRDRLVEKRWGPRTADIDILAFGDISMKSADLTLPHPLMFERSFVLVPLAEIAGERVIAGKRLRDAVHRIDTTGIRKLPAR